MKRPFGHAADMKPDFRELVKAHEALIKPIMQSILTYLKCDPHSYDDKLTKTNFGFRLNYYPALSNEANRPMGAGRMLGHEDVDPFHHPPRIQSGRPTSIEPEKQ